MIDKEKVIKGLELCKTGRCDSRCHYNHINVGCRKQLADDTLVLLKEQEAKTGTWQWKIHGKAESGGTLGEAICDQCGESTYATAVKGDLNYCPNCGAKMKRLKAVK